MTMAMPSTQKANSCRQTSQCAPVVSKGRTVHIYCFSSCLHSQQQYTKMSAQTSDSSRVKRSQSKVFGPATFII
jgi:hypothetical protein